MKENCVPHEVEWEGRVVAGRIKCCPLSRGGKRTSGENCEMGFRDFGLGRGKRDEEKKGDVNTFV